MTAPRPRWLLLGCALASLVQGMALRASAGCGCEKPPPPPAAVRPAVTWPGREVTLFDDDLVAGREYDVRFASGTGPGAATVRARALLRRDLADRSLAPQLALALPELPLGPTSIEVSAVATGAPVLALGDDAFTVAPRPLAVMSGVDVYQLPGARAAVGRDGTVYLSLDFSDVHEARIFRAQARGYPLRFGHQDVRFLNVQGFLMQVLGRNMPGLFALDAGSGSDSDLLQYSRHEFNTYLMTHDERRPHALDPQDPNWHLDGSPHIDHDHQILAIAAALPGGAAPVPGATPAFDLVIEAFTLFHHGLLADEQLEVSGRSVVDSYRSSSGALGHAGDVRSQGPAFVDVDAVVDGSLEAVSLEVLGTVTGSISQLGEVEALLPVDVPSGAEDLGKLEVKNDDVRILSPGSYRVDELIVGSDATLVIDNLDGPVTLYVTDKVDVSTTSSVETTALDPERFAVYVANDGEVKISNGAGFHGVIYAPGSLVEVSGNGEFFGAFVGREVKLTGDSLVHYDEDLRRTDPLSPLPPGVVPGNGSGGGAAELEIKKARFASRSRRLSVRVAAAAGADVPLTLSVDGWVKAAPMKWNARRRAWVYRAKSAVDLEGRALLVRAGDGASASAVVD